jgi:hypothetical protein
MYCERVLFGRGAVADPIGPIGFDPPPGGFEKVPMPTPTPTRGLPPGLPPPLKRICATCSF